MFSSLIVVGALALLAFDVARHGWWHLAAGAGGFGTAAGVRLAVSTLHARSRRRRSG